MGILELLVLGIGLSMDSFAVALCKGLKMRDKWIGKGFKLAFIFAFFQTLMPFIGYVIGEKFANAVSNYDHWIAFVILIILGGKMIYEGLLKENNSQENEDFSIKELSLLGMATSIDALAIGVTLSFFNVNLLLALVTIFACTFIISLFGTFIGKKASVALKDYAEILGGIILVTIGAKILFEHLNLF